MSTELNKVDSQTAVAEAKARKWRRPNYDVTEEADRFEVTVSVPGVSKGGVDISVHEDTLTLTATRSISTPDAWRPLRRELPEGDYRLSLRLNVRINEDKIAAHVADGLLTLTLPKADEVKPRKIKVS